MSTVAGGSAVSEPACPDAHGDRQGALRAAGARGRSTLSGAGRRGLPSALRQALACAAALLLLCAPACRRGPPPPNVLLIVVDTLRADRMSLYGYPRPTSPGLEDFARDAVVFDDAWSPASWTVPAHAGMFTGTAPYRLDLYDGLNARLAGGTTLAERLSGAGFQTAAFTANPWVSSATRLTRGFGTVRQMLASDAEAPTSERVLGALLAWVRERPKAAPGAPWFAFANVMDVHAPYDPPPEESARFRRPGLPAAAVAEARAITGGNKLTDDSLGLRRLDPDVGTAISDLYDANVAVVDAALAHLLEQLRTDGTLDRTLVIIASDHGEGLGDHGWREHGVHFHRELLRVLLALRLPGRFEGGRRVGSLVSLMDVTPTVLAACGLDFDAGPDGRDLAQPADDRFVTATDHPYGGCSWLAGTDLPAHARTHLETRRYSGFDGRLHAIVDDHGGAELYDVVADPRELQNLAAAAPAVLARMRARLVQEFGAGAAAR